MESEEAYTHPDGTVHPPDGDEYTVGDYVAVPVGVAAVIAENFNKSIVIVLAWDPVHKLLHTTTFGDSANDKAWAAQGGEIATWALIGRPAPNFGTPIVFEDYRLTQAKKLLVSLKELMPFAEQAMPAPCHEGACGPDAGCDGICMERAACSKPLMQASIAIKEAEQFLGV